MDVSIYTMKAKGGPRKGIAAGEQNLKEKH